MQQAQDFLEESDTLAALLDSLASSDWDRATQFKNWTINDVLVHLYFWNRAADQALVAPDRFQLMMGTVMAEMAGGGLRPIENRMIPERGRDLFVVWQAQYRDMAARWGEIDPKTRVKWVGPEMSVRSSITARQMETWAHGMEVFDIMGRTRTDADRIANVVMLGVNTFGWSHKVQELDVPDQMPFLRLTAPSGAVWEYGEASDVERIEGPAVAFAQVVTQTRNVADTALRIAGPVAERWMQTAQCFAGGKETPPAPGTRFVAAG
ncbi:MAG: TIGR03084 family metal-binding protein [Pseudomonadota bacterium]